MCTQRQRLDQRAAPAFKHWRCVLAFVDTRLAVCFGEALVRTHEIPTIRSGLLIDQHYWRH